MGEIAKPCYQGKWTIFDNKMRIRDNNPKDLGYVDVNIRLGLPGGWVTEVQIHVLGILYGKLGRIQFMEEACLPGTGEDIYLNMEKKAGTALL